CLVGPGEGERWVVVGAIPRPGPGSRTGAVLAIHDMGMLAAGARELDSYVARQTVLLEATRALLGAPGGLKQAAAAAVDLTTRLVEAPYVALYATTEPEVEELALLAWQRKTEGRWQPPASRGTVELSTGPAGHGLARLASPDERGLPEDCAPADVVLAAVRGQEGGSLVLLVASPQRQWSEAELDFLASWVEFVRASLELAAARDRLGDRVEAYRRLLAVALALQKTSNLDDVLPQVTRFALQTVEGLWGYVHLLRDDGQRFERLFGPVAAEGVLAPRPLQPRPAGLSWAAISRGEIVEARSGALADGPRLRPELADLGVKHSIAVPLKGEEGPIGVLVVDRDLDAPLSEEQRRTLEVFAAHAAAAVIGARLRERLAVSESNYRVLFERSAAAVLLLDSAGRIVLANPRFEEMTGYRREEVQGKMKAILLVAPEDWKRVKEWRRRQKGEQRSGPDTWELDYISAQGQRRRAKMSVTYVPESGQTLLTIVDVTRERQLQQQLVQMEKAAALGQLVAGVAHELNNPLGAISGSAELALAGRPPADVVPHLQRIFEQAQRCRRIVMNLLLFAREAHGERVPVDVNAVVAQTLDLRAYELAVDNIEVELSLDHALPLVTGDASRLQQALFNLVLNAHQALRSQGGGKLRVTTRSAEDRVILEVADTGPGISPDHLPRIFDPFFTTKPPGEGTGMGLSVSLGIIRDMGGDLTASSTPAQGACFTVTLPLAGPVPDWSEPEPSLTTPTPHRSSAPVAARLLVVDDEPAVRDVIRTALEAEGYSVESCGDAQDALELLTEQDFDAVICDLRLPGMDGPTLYHLAARRRPELTRRFLFVTGDTVSEASRQFLQTTGAPALNKPFELDELHTAVASVVAGLRDPRDQG
ncbi:MAG: PAS domain S-box protein, partial [Armatimonadetes bacterium]|nr:PAS domain S-box protein [Armatimonadota bacterium]